MRRHFFLCFIAILLSLAGSLLLQAQQPMKTNSATAQIHPEVAKDRRYAMDLYDSDKKLDALPWLEKVALALPEDNEVQERLGVCRLDLAETLPDLNARKAKRIEARKAMLRAKELGNNSDIVVILLNGIPEDGSDRKLSDNAEIDRILKAGEAAFAARKLDEAKESYLRVIAIDPNHATAMLYMGDVYYAQKKFGSAIEWFSRSAKADPEREAAFRYWADALLALGRFSEAREKYMMSVIANPYRQSSWSGLNKWSKFTGKSLTWYKITPGSSVQQGKEGSNNINISISALMGDKDDGSSAWIMYAMEKALWQSEKFKKEFPNEPKYRHTLKEEASALDMVATVATEQGEGKKKKKRKLAPDIEILLNLKNEGFIEPYVLLNAPDNDIAKDYAEYREKHRDVLVRYLNKIVVPVGPADKPQKDSAAGQ